MLHPGDAALMDVLIVSAALDTNAQNYRYAEAAKRWGDDPDVIKALVAGDYDPADVGGRFREAARKLGGLAIRSAHVAEAYFEFPSDIRWTRQTHAEVQQLADEADLVHLNNSPRAYMKLRLVQQRKPALLHHHGTLFRNNPVPLLDTARRFNMVQAVSTIDLQRVAPDVLHWLPTAYDLDALAELRKRHQRPADGRVRIVSAPTNREIKSTALLEAAVHRLQAEGLPVDLVLVEGRPWAECLEIKASADIYFDQVKLGYGCNAIEAWGMGIPVIAGADEWTLARMREVWKTDELPFYTATEDTIADAIRALATSKALRATWGRIGKVHAVKYHAEKAALARLAELYGMALAKAQTGGGDWQMFPDTPGTFTTDQTRPVNVALGSFRFRLAPEQRIDLDGRLARKMRQFAHTRHSHKIREIA